jgi:hypothetical protein
MTGSTGSGGGRGAPSCSDGFVAGFLRVVAFFRVVVFLAAGFLRVVAFFRVVVFLRVALLVRAAALLLLAGIATTFPIVDDNPPILSRRPWNSATRTSSELLIDCEENRSLGRAGRDVEGG